MNARITLAAFLLISLIVAGCGAGTKAAGSANGQNLSSGSSLDTTSDSSQCRSHFDSTICPMIATNPPTQCSANGFIDGQSLATPLSANGPNSCLVTVELEDLACEVGYTWEQVQNLKISCP